MIDNYSYFKTRYPVGYLTSNHDIKATVADGTQTSNNEIPWATIIILLGVGFIAYQLIKEQQKKENKNYTNLYE